MGELFRFEQEMNVTYQRILCMVVKQLQELARFMLLVAIGPREYQNSNMTLQRT